jgi:hypothetical protein
MNYTRVHRSQYLWQLILRTIIIVCVVGVVAGLRSAPAAASNHLLTWSNVTNGRYLTYSTAHTRYKKQVRAAARFWNRAAGRTVVRAARANQTADVYFVDYEGANRGPAGMAHAGHVTVLSVGVINYMRHPGRGYIPAKYFAPDVLIHEMGHSLGIAHFGTSRRYGKEAMTASITGLVAFKPTAAARRAVRTARRRWRTSLRSSTPVSVTAWQEPTAARAILGV